MAPENTDYSKANFQLSLEDLDNKFYSRIQVLCEQVTLNITNLHDGDVHQTASLYTSLAKRLIEQVAVYLNTNRNVLMPYMEKLAVKEDEKQESTSASHIYQIDYGVQVTRIRMDHEAIQRTLEDLNSIILPIKHSSLHTTANHALRNAVGNLYELLTDLFQQEYLLLIPKIPETQAGIKSSG
jgi:hypothetical protein